MQIQVNTDRNIVADEALAAHVRGVVAGALGRYSDHITRVEVHLTDENSHKSGPNDKRCVIEARLENRKPVAATHEAATSHQAVDGAAGKLAAIIEGVLGRLRDQRRTRAEPPPNGSQVGEE